MVESKVSCEKKLATLQKIISFGMDTIMLLQTKTVVANEAPWVNKSLKTLIRRRQNALSRGEMVKYRALRNQVNRERKRCRSKFYEEKVKHLKDCKLAL